MNTIWLDIDLKYFIKEKRGEITLFQTNLVNSRLISLINFNPNQESSRLIEIKLNG